MGCCVSSGKSFNSADKFNRNSAAAGGKISGAITDHGSREPPSSMEEETVKEVLSETPALKPPAPPPPSKNRPPEEEEAQKRVGGKVENEEDEIEKKIRVIPSNFVTEQASEFSEISSPSECLSATTFTDKMDDGEEVHQRVFRSSPVKFPKNQTFSGDVGLRREILPNRTLNRRCDQSPVRRNGAVGSVRLVQNRDTNGPAMARRGLRAEPLRRDPGENSGRRSRSPATARSDGGGPRPALGRTPSVRKSGKSSPVRAATAPAASPQKVAEETNIIGGKFTTHSESLENPLVSLECFIFL